MELIGYYWAIAFWGRGLGSVHFLNTFNQSLRVKTDLTELSVCLPSPLQLQSLTLRPPPPGSLTIPPSLRLKPPSSVPPPLSRPHAPLFPPLRPRPQPSTMATESPTTPSRHLSVPPPSRSLKETDAGCGNGGRQCMSMWALFRFYINYYTTWVKIKIS